MDTEDLPEMLSISVSFRVALSQRTLWNDTALNEIIKEAGEHARSAAEEEARRKLTELRATDEKHASR